MTTENLIMIAAVLLGPIAAVLITLWHQDRKQKREQRIALLRHLLALRVFPSDINYTHAINMIPMEFADNPKVIAAHKEFIAAANHGGTDDQARLGNVSVKLTRLVFEVSHSLGFKVRETDLQTEAYTADGVVRRDEVFLDGQRAWRDIANLLFIQARQAQGVELTAKELEYLGIPPKSGLIDREG